MFLGSMASASHSNELTESCSGCHGDKGVSQWSDMPTIAGQAEFYQSEQLFAYRDKARPCAEAEYRQGDTTRPPTDMCRIAGALSDDQIEELSKAYAALPFVPAKQEFDASLAVTGKAIHEEHCDRCHTEGGTNVEDEAGMLGGQWMSYLEATFAEYAAGKREQPEKMEEKLKLLGDADVKALVHYYASQQ
jgi:sulfide dehydrogenase cytochrome subunit